MKKNLMILAALSAIFMTSCKEDPVAPVPGGSDFLDVELTFGHYEVAPETGMTVHVDAYESAVSGVDVADLKPAYSISKELEEADLKKVMLTLEGLDAEAKTPLYVMAWVDVDKNGSLSEGDLAMWYKAQIEKVVAKEQTPENCRGEYVIEMKITYVYGEKEFVVPEGKAADAERNLYDVVTIGPRIWLATNLRTRTYQDGTEIPAFVANDDTPWVVNPYETAEGGDELLKEFGMLYSWAAGVTKNPCPEGYRVPSDEDFMKTEAFLAPNVADEITPAGIKNTNRGGDELRFAMVSGKYYGHTNENLFNAVPNGQWNKGVHDQGYDTDALLATFWTTDEIADGETMKGIRRITKSTFAGFGSGANAKTVGHGIRCVKDNPDYIEIEKTDLAVPVLSVNGTVVTWTAVSNATGYNVSIDDNEVDAEYVSENAGTFTFDVISLRKQTEEDRIYTVEVEAYGDGSLYNKSKSSIDVTVPAMEVIPEKEYVKDADGNEYEVVTIGTQKWIKSNLRATKYEDGTEIPMPESAAGFGADTPQVYNPHSTTEDAVKYGYMYNWYVGTSGKNPCPAGYKVPSDADFVKFEVFVSGEDAATLAPVGTVAGTVPDKNDNRSNAVPGLKLMSMDENGTDDYGFCGYYSGQLKVGGTLDQLGKMIALWTTDYTDKADEVNGARRLFKSNSTGLGRGGGAKNIGHSIRCVKNIE